MSIRRPWPVIANLKISTKDCDFEIACDSWCTYNLLKLDIHMLENY